MISRAAENCFWLFKQIERMDSISRSLYVNSSYVLDIKPALSERWYPFVIVAGEENRFLESYSEDATLNTDLILYYLIWELKNPVSIFNAIDQARENARIIRDVLSIEIWQAINSFWLWMKSKRSFNLYNKDLPAFLQEIKNNCITIHGLFHNSMLQEEPYYFMQLGMMLERSNQTARLVDVKYHRHSLAGNNINESAEETLYWLALLKCCSANESFLKRSYFTINRKQVAEFLILEQTFPRAILYCLLKAKYCLVQLNSIDEYDIGKNSMELLQELINSIKSKSIDNFFDVGSHEELARIVNATAEICDAIHKDFFDPDLTISNHFKEFSK